MSHHDLKLWPEYMEAKRRGVKPWEHRSTSDRSFSVGDSVTFLGYDPTISQLDGQEYGPCRITYIHRLDKSHCIFTHTAPGEKP